MRETRVWITIGLGTSGMKDEHALQTQRMFNISNLTVLVKTNSSFKRLLGRWSGAYVNNWSMLTTQVANKRGAADYISVTYSLCFTRQMRECAGSTVAAPPCGVQWNLRSYGSASVDGVRALRTRVYADLTLVLTLRFEFIVSNR